MNVIVELRNLADAIDSGKFLVLEYGEERETEIETGNDSTAANMHKVYSGKIYICIVIEERS